MLCVVSFRVKIPVSAAIAKLVVSKLLIPTVKRFEASVGRAGAVQLIHWSVGVFELAPKSTDLEILGVMIFVPDANTWPEDVPLEVVDGESFFGVSTGKLEVLALLATPELTVVEGVEEGSL